MSNQFYPYFLQYNLKHFKYLKSHHLIIINNFLNFIVIINLLKYFVEKNI